VVTLDARTQVRGPLLDDAWELYTRSFEELRSRAVQRHLMHREEFDEVMADSRVTKYVALSDDGRLAGLATLTNDLASMPLISPDYFAARWPERYEDKRVFYIGFVAVHPDYQGTGAFSDLITTMAGVAAHVDGVAVFDVCDLNQTKYRLPPVISRLVRNRFAASRVEKLDSQTYLGYLFGETA